MQTGITFIKPYKSTWKTWEFQWLLLNMLWNQQVYCSEACGFQGDGDSSHGLWAVKPCDVAGYQHFREPCCFHLQGHNPEYWDLKFIIIMEKHTRVTHIYPSW